ncbi:AsmA family protein [Rhodalgimonas zhirmunskyi]|uniref:AsmA family protein n=1 Tax=Rhodalgimonas zhirmunskyi TaxID=2964767 RepID=A0AAJ1UC97_9RHOB|nr:AsmA-like C-terminal region-containing protein [Rhodoalgimonas zhirmunskyi]MDQ2095248.1 AsmA family protein [Rhodoalgimonas zhirmunskyi]
MSDKPEITTEPEDTPRAGDGDACGDAAQALAADAKSGALPSFLRAPGAQGEKAQGEKDDLSEIEPHESAEDQSETEQTDAGGPLAGATVEDPESAEAGAGDETADETDGDKADWPEGEEIDGPEGEESDEPEGDETPVGDLAGDVIDEEAVGGAADVEEESAGTPEQEQSEETLGAAAIAPTRKPRSKRHKIGLAGLILIAVLTIVGGVTVLLLIGRPLVAPAWLEARIEDQVNRRLAGAKVGFGEVALVVEEGWKPRLHLRDVDFADAEGRHLLRLSDVEATLAMQPLLRGEVQPARIWLSGAIVVVRRDKDGNVELSFGEGGASAQQAAGFMQLMARADTALSTPALADLKSFEANGLSVRFEDVRAGRGWTVDGGRVALTRADDTLSIRGDFALLSGRAYASTLGMSYNSRIGSAAAQFGMNFEDVPASDIAVQSPALYWLNVLRAPISGALRGSTDEAGSLGPLSATLRIGEGVLQPTDETKPIPFKSAQSYFTYDPAAQSMRFDEMTIDSAWGRAKAEGKVAMGRLENGLPREFIGQMTVTEIAANPMDLYPEPVRLTDVMMVSRLELAPFRFTVGQMTVRDGDSRLVLGGELRAGEAGWDLSLDGRMNKMGPERLLELWPESVKPRTRTWIVENILAGQMRNIQLGLKTQPGDEKPALFLGFDFEDVSTLFLKTMPPATGGRGHATLSNHRFTVVANAGQVAPDRGGPVQIAGTVFTIPDVRVNEGPGEVDLVTRSSITAALSLLDREQFRFISKAGQSIDVATGRADVKGHIDFLRKKNQPPESVKFTAQATLRDVVSERIVPGKKLTAAQLALEASNTQLKISGPGQVGDVKADATFEAPLGKAGATSTVRGWVELSPTFVREFNLGLPSGSVSGAGRGDLAIDLKRGEKPEFSLTSNLSGLGLSVPQIGWSMSRGATGRLKVAGRLGSPVEVSEIVLDAPGLEATGRLVLGADSSFQQAQFSRIKAGSWLDAPVTLVSRGAGASPEVRVEGGSVDLSQTEIGEGEGSGNSQGQGGGPMNVRLDRLRISESIALTNFVGQFSTAKGIDGNFQGRVNGGAAVTGRVVPRNGRSAFRIQSKDAGGVFRSSGLLENAHGGELDLTLLPSGGPGRYDGTLESKNVWLRKAPAMAELLNAISVIGLLEQLSGRGILFGEVEAKFHLSPKQVTLFRSSAVGASMGISMDGYYYFDSSTMRFQGTVSPIYLVNAVGAVLTRKGEGLLGFSYKLEGTPDKPKVKVNPLSILTPGMFREIFRRPPPRVAE